MSISHHTARVSLPTFGLSAIIGGLFVWFAHRPLWHTDLWGHLAYGRIIWNTGQIPATEPLLAFAADEPFVDLAWLSQSAGYLVHECCGIAGLQTLYGAAVAAICGIFLWTTFARTGSGAWSTLGAALFLGVDWRQLEIIRPQLAGLAAFVLLVGLVHSHSWRRPGIRRHEVPTRNVGECKPLLPRLRCRFVLTSTVRRMTVRRMTGWPFLPVVVLFAAWTNLHGSFPAGLLWLGTVVLGRAWDVSRRGRNWALVWRDQRLRRLLALSVAAACGACLNPYHLRTYPAIWSITGNPNIADLVEWQPLTLRMQQGRAAFAAVVLLAIALKLSPRRIRAAEWLPLVVFGWLAVRTSRMIVWWAPLAGFTFAVHAAAAWRRFAPPRLAAHWKCAAQPGFVFAVGFIAAALSPLGLQWLGRLPADERRGLSPFTPVTAAAHLRKHPPAGVVLSTFDWGDYLLWAGGVVGKVLAASHVHLISPEVWRDYRRALRMEPGWEQVLDRYGVSTVVLDRTRHGALRQRLERNGGWRMEFEDQQAVVLVRAHKESASAGPWSAAFRISRSAYPIRHPHRTVVPCGRGMYPHRLGSGLRVRPPA